MSDTTDRRQRPGMPLGPGRLRWVPPGAARRAAGAMHVTEREEALMHHAHYVTEARSALWRAKRDEPPAVKRHWLRVARDAGRFARNWLETACGEGVDA